MASILVCYGTGEGQTATVAERIVDVPDERGHDATVVNAAERPADLAVSDFDAVLVGASIHAGKHQPAVRKFIDENRDALAAMPTAFFQVSLSSADERGAGQAAAYVDELVEETGWHPDRIGFFGGALRYSEYGFVKRLLMKQVAKRAIPNVNTSGDVEFTDWDEVESFATDVAAFVEERLGVPTPASESDRSR